MTEDKRTLRIDHTCIVGVGVPIESDDLRNGAYPNWVLVADSALFPATPERYRQDAAALYGFFLHKIPWETWDAFEELSSRRKGPKEE